MRRGRDIKLTRIKNCEIAQGLVTLIVKVGGKQDTASARTRALYLRQGTEDSEEAAQTTGDDCESVIVSDVAANSLTIHTDGLSFMNAKAWGNGHADAYTESLNVQVLVGICFCPGKRPTYEAIVNGGWYENDGTFTRAIVDQLQDDLVDMVDQKIGQAGFDNASSGSAWETEVKNFVNDWSGRHPHIAGGCE